MLHSNIIGIIGGLGPAAGADLMQKIIDHTIAQRDQDHFSVALLSYADQIPDRATFINDSTKPDPVIPLSEVVKRLELLEAKVAGLPCVTAHVPVIFGRLRTELQARNSPLRLLSMVEETVQMIQRDYGHIRRVAAISTWATFRNRLFYDPLEKAGFEVVYQSPVVQELVEQAIYNPQFGIKATSNPVHPQARKHLLTAVKHLKDQGAEAIILGCTELPIGIPETVIEGLPTIDPTLALARALIHALDPAKLKPLII
jgi:aspartate racemase